MFKPLHLHRAFFWVGLAVCLALMCGNARAQVWRALGPQGGDVRALAIDPRNPKVLYLGTTDGHIFTSRDAGDHWQILGRAGESRQAVVTAIIVDPGDPTEIYASEWTRDPRGEGGGVFRSRDGGASWQPMGLPGHAVRALAQAPSDRNEFVAGALDGVFLSGDGGATWQRISPEKDAELQNVDSVAIDPRDPAVVYVGTFHLPWKTADSGKHWAPIHSGMIDDSDVFSLLVDRRKPDRIFATACSGIYRSDNAGGLWTKIQGIPFSARRTHTIVQDPSHPEIVYAGTTEGLWKTADGGANWQLMTPASWVINAMAVEPNSQRLILGTEQLGVLVSDDGGNFFHVSDDGFDHREIISVAWNRRQGSLVAALADAPEPILQTADNGQAWFPMGGGLRSGDLRKIYSSPRGWLAALDHGGLELYNSARRQWFHIGEVEDADGARQFEAVINDIAFERTSWFAATNSGLFVSHDSGEKWSSMRLSSPNLPLDSVTLLASGRTIWVVSSGGMLCSMDAGRTWRWRDLPLSSGGALALHANGTMLLASAQRGLYVSRDDGATWALEAHGLPAGPPQDVTVAGSDWLVSMRDGGLYLSQDSGANWNRLAGTVADGYFPLITRGSSPESIYVASTTEGLYSLNLPARVSGATAQSGGQRH